MGSSWRRAAVGGEKERKETTNLKACREAPELQAVFIQIKKWGVFLGFHICSLPSLAKKSCPWQWGGSCFNAHNPLSLQRTLWEFSFGGLRMLCSQNHANWIVSVRVPPFASMLLFFPCTKDVKAQPLRPWTVRSVWFFYIRFNSLPGCGWPFWSPEMKHQVS